MGKIPELPGDQAEVVAWLRSEAGERWSAARIGFTSRIHRHGHDSGVFAEIIPDGRQCPVVMLLSQGSGDPL